MKSCLGLSTLSLYDALICLTACYPKKFGPRGIGHAGVIFIGLQCDIEDEGYEPLYSLYQIKRISFAALTLCALTDLPEFIKNSHPKIYCNALELEF